MGGGKRKTYVLDTNILMHSPNAVFGFADNTIVITGTTLQELDRHKTDAGETGFNTREAIRILDTLTEKTDPLKGISLPGKGKLYFEPDCIEEGNLPDGFDISVPDNRILSAVMGMKKKAEYGQPVILVTNDTSMRLNARICKIEVQSYKNEMIETDERYAGRCRMELPDEKIDELYQENGIDLELSGSGLVENEYVHVTGVINPKKSAICIYQNNRLIPIRSSKLQGYGGIKGRNAAQQMLMHALSAPAEEIPLVIAIGPAGTGKTLLAIACGLEQTYRSLKGRGENLYEKILITRTNTLSDEEHGFLPGTLEEKMSPLVAPFMDNMTTIFAGKERDLELAEQQIAFVKAKGIVQIESVGYMRGRSLSNTYLIVDEAQNMSVHQALEIVSRAAMGTKVVLLGDPDQIDARYLDKRTNGLVFTSERMKGSNLCAQITFDQEESVRSPLAMEAAKRMTV